LNQCCVPTPPQNLFQRPAKPIAEPALRPDVHAARSDSSEPSAAQSSASSIANFAEPAQQPPPANGMTSEPRAARQPAADKPAELGSPAAVAECSQRRDLTGAAGGPSSVHIVEGELDRRIGLLKRGEFLGQSITGVANLLAMWWKEKRRPEEAPLTPKAIINSIKLRTKIGKHIRARRARN